MDSDADITRTNHSSVYSILPLPLDSKCIRLLEIHGLTTEQGEESPMIASLSVVDLNDRPFFSALSYVWGVESSQPPRILCNGILIPVTENCFSALWHLRTKLGTFKVWVDAICINQNDEKEKERQIPLMSEIYSSAAPVYVWLGEGNEATERAMDYMGTTGFLKYYFTNGDPDHVPLSQPRIWGAAFSVYLTRWRPTNSPHLTDAGKHPVVLMFFCLLNRSWLNFRLIF